MRSCRANFYGLHRPGIGVRVLGDITPERVEIARKADHIFISMIKEAGIYNEASFLKSVARATADTENRCPKPMLVWIPTRVCVPEMRRLRYLSRLRQLTIFTAVGVMGDTRVYGYIVM